MIHTASTLSGNYVPQDSPQPAYENQASAQPIEAVQTAHTFHVVYCTGSSHGAMWEVQVVAADVADAERATRYFAMHRHEAEIHVVAIVCTETVK